MVLFNGLMSKATSTASRSPRKVNMIDMEDTNARQAVFHTCYRFEKDHIDCLGLC